MKTKREKSLELGERTKSGVSAHSQGLIVWKASAAIGSG